MKATAAQLWSVLDDLRRMPDWLEFAAALEEASSDKAARGAFYTIKPRGRFEPKTHWRLTDVDPHRRQVHEADMPMLRDVNSTIEIRVRQNGGARAHVHWHGTPSNLRGRLARPMFQRRITQNWERSLANLDELALSDPH
jgi:hypothetical protein